MNVFSHTPNAAGLCALIEQHVCHRTPCLLTANTMHEWVAPNALTFFKKLLYQHQQKFISCGFTLILVWSGLVWSFKRNSQCVESVAPDYAVQAKRVLMLGHEYLLHPSSLAKHVTAFFSDALTTDTFALNDTLSSLINDLIDR